MDYVVTLRRDARAVYVGLGERDIVYPHSGYSTLVEFQVCVFGSPLIAESHIVYMEQIRDAAAFLVEVAYISTIGLDNTCHAVDISRRVYLHASPALSLVYDEGVDLHFLSNVHAVGFQYPVAVLILEEAPTRSAD